MKAKNVLSQGYATEIRKRDRGQPELQPDSFQEFECMEAIGLAFLQKSQLSLIFMIILRKVSKQMSFLSSHKDWDIGTLYKY